MNGVVDHTDRFRAIKGALLAEVPNVRVQAFAMVAVSDSGEVFWGASYGPGANLMTRRLLHMAAEAAGMPTSSITGG